MKNRFYVVFDADFRDYLCCDTQTNDIYASFESEPEAHAWCDAHNMAA